MRKIKIFALPSHQTPDRTSGVDFARIIQPTKHLHGYKDDEVEFEVKQFDINEKLDWLSVSQEFDIIYFNYLNSPWGFAALGAMARKLGVKMVMDLDDNLWEIREDNPAHVAYFKGSQALKDFEAICNEVDFMTVTSSYLKNVVVNNTYKKHEKIQVLPNYIDLELYKHRNEFKDYGRIQLMHFGSTTHFEDLSNQEFLKGVDKIMKEYPNVTVRFVGAFLPKLKDMWGMRYETVYGDSDIYKWINQKFPVFMSQADILVVPLEENKYTRCKSDIKYLEASSAKIPGVYQRIRQYTETIEDGKDGFLATKAEEWYEKIKRLIDDVQLRKSMGEAAFQKVKETKQINDHVSDYADFFKRVVDKS